ncbi:hypothetical protein G8S49_11260 [Clostridium botulinum C]|uniref:Uncharacterized protein n=2 Tax=Clostridium botulinum TaxID=1491 RepID=A0A9Q4TIA2_CLOBO|nr:hypothetical protein [Clostridium botulinum]EGO86229.1 hypothetical protein CBCST_22980 [Clostridium botulinum C str. Stockholm]MCD3195731.1 hypothetical protein [Clostridium botulinum C]MCD3201147.1 hypothetical protein [Clostridium botulinum C]MCD3206601.1 hypothetical protein [Clostridium botulinum C]MCD3209400.1 hypothetical protein [Clostridium botulinum C]
MFGVWNEEQENFLKDNYKYMTYKEIGEKINKSENAVSKKAQFFNLKKIERNKIELPRETQVRREINGRMKMKKYGIDKEIGDKAIIKTRYGLKSPIRILEGEIIFKSKNIITIQSKNYKESFMFSEFYTGQAVLI